MFPICWQLFLPLFLLGTPLLILAQITPNERVLPAELEFMSKDRDRDYVRRRTQQYSGNVWSSNNKKATGGGVRGNAFSNAKELQKKIKRPPTFGSSYRQPLSVKLGFYLESLGDFRETQMSFEVDLYMYMSWRDQTLQHAGPDMVMINDDMLRKDLWLPDLYFANARQANFHEVTIPNFNLFIQPDGTVSYSSRVTLTVACNLDLLDYPMDYQICNIRVLSYSYIAKIVNVTWFKNSPIMYNPEIDLPEFEIENVEAAYCNGTYRYAVTERSFRSDKFSCLKGNLHLRRRIGFNMVQSYIPTGLIVIISWVAFWIDRRAVPARVMLSFTTLLTITTIGNGMRFGLPRVSYSKAIDYWFGGCMFFVFVALLEFALVNSYMRRSEKYERLANKYKRKNSADNLALSPIFSSELARSYAEMVKLRRKSTPFAILEELSKGLGFLDSPILNKKKLYKGESSQSLSEHSKSEDHSSPSSPKEQRRQRNSEAADDNNNNKKNDQHKQGEAGALLDGSYYDNMHSTLDKRNATARKAAVIEMPNGSVSRRNPNNPQQNGGKISSVQFMVDDPVDQKQPLVAGSNPYGGSGDKDKVEPDPQLSLKYLETCQLLSRRALLIDKCSRILFPLAFIIFNIAYWGYYLIVRQRKLM